MMDIDLLKKLQPILSNEGLSDCSELSYNALLCSRGNQRVVLKAGKRVRHNETKKLGVLLKKMQQLGFEKISVPQFISMSSKDGEVQYLITSFIEADAPRWSESDTSPDLGGQTISLAYLPFVKQAVEELDKADHSNLDLEDDRDQVEVAIKTLGQLRAKQLISDDVSNDVHKLLSRGAEKYYGERLVLSNGDFYPRNVLMGKDNPTVVIDWDGARLTVREHMLMYFWCSMFGNKKLQDELLDYYKQSNFDKDRFAFGLEIAALEDIRLWLQHDHCTQALQAYISYLKNYESIVGNHLISKFCVIGFLSRTVFDFRYSVVVTQAMIACLSSRLPVKRMCLA